MKLLERVREKLRVLHYALRTEEAYLHWIERYIRFHNIRHPNTMGAGRVEPESGQSESAQKHNGLR